TLDITIAGIALLLSMPLFITIALAIRLTSPGPAIFRQERVGYRGRRFEFLKFRSMRVGSSPDIHQAYTDHWIHGRSGAGDGARGELHKLESDPRITPVGRFLRKTSLDELPQLINVLQGHMSLVGPRPPLPYEVERYTEWHKRRLEVPPGLTGLWQISGRNNISFDQMVALDLAYIEQWSLLRDIEILLKTVPALVASRGH
ncbi:MAG TPA: sugar transferase, partial [Acidimicrobiia bacterium]